MTRPTLKRGELNRLYRPHILTIVALTLILFSGLHNNLRNALADLRFALSTREASGSIVVVAIDAPSIEKIGVWPWPRRLHANLIRQLEKAEARDIVFDVDFSTPSDASSDQTFEEALRSAGGSVFLPSFEQPGAKAGDKVHINHPLKQFSDQSWSAIVNVAVGPDGLVRQYPFGKNLGGQFLPSMGAALAGQFSAKASAFLVDFGIRSASIPKVSYADVLRGDSETLGKLKGKKIIIGGTALELGDRFSIPNGRVISGPLLQAMAAESILQGRALRWTSQIVTLVGLALISLMMMWAGSRVTAGRKAICLIGMSAALEAFALVLQAKWPFILDTSLFQIQIAVYIGVIGLEEIDFRGLLRRISENRFQRIAMSLGDGLVCTDSNHRITLWNPGAAAIFGYDSAEVNGLPFNVLCAARTESNVRLLPTLELSSGEATCGAVTEFDGRRKNGEVFPVEASFSSWEGADGVQFGAILRDISVRKREAERIRYLAEHDPLTGLANRTTLQARLGEMITLAEGRHDEVALMVLGLDGFQAIHHMLGQICGDVVLCAASDRLRSESRGRGIVARLSGDEFAIAVPLSETKETIDQFSERIALSFKTPLVAGSREHRIGVTIGAVVYPHGGQTADELLANGHLAFSRAKATRRGSYALFQDTFRHELEKRVITEAELALAVERNEFELFFQPQVNLTDSSLIGAEALIRWNHPNRGLIPPSEFMPLVNTSSISDRVGTWVLETACKQAASWEQDGQPIRIGVNLSPSQLQYGDLVGSVIDVLARTRLTPSLLELEVTEDILLANAEQVLDTILRIQQLGVRFVFDDFGTGYASLSYLKKFPLDGLKIDRSFVSELLTDSTDAAIVKSTIDLGRQLNLSIIAEGVEDRATADFLASMGCEEGQGYFFGKPMDVSTFEGRFLVAVPTSVKAIEAA
jgi:diguanylate cyclase (GGDEF)-like protein/PAS domain S-box-containing protein